MANKKRTTAILSAVILALISGCSNGSESIDFGEHSEHAQTAEESTQAIYSAPVIGANSILAQDTRGDITATLELLNISGLPDGSQENNYYSGQYLVVRIRDGKSCISIANTLPEHYAFKHETYPPEGNMRINADCVADSVELLSVENGGKTEYVLKVEYVQGPDRRVAAFASCDMSEYGESGGRLKWCDVTYDYTPQFTYQYCMVSESFGYKGGSTFADGHLEQVYEFDTKNRIVKISSMDESDIVFGEPKIGNHSVLSQCTLGDHLAAVEIHNIRSLPWEDPDDRVYSDRLYSGEKLFVKLCVNDRIIACGGIPNGYVSGGGQWINPSAIQEECTGDGATRIFQVEQDGFTYHVLMQYGIYDEEEKTVGAFFACFDEKFYDDYAAAEGYDETLPPKWYSFYGAPEIANKWGIPISESFEYVGDGLFRDRGYGYEIQFDCGNINGEVRMLSE